MKVVIGICTGRCGSQSLAEIISKQDKTLSYHEVYWRARGTTFRDKYPILSIIDSSHPDLYLKYIESLMMKYQKYGDVFFDIGPYTKNCISALKENFSDIKFVILKRNFVDFKKSFMRKDVQMGTLGKKRIIPFDSAEKYYNFIYDKNIMNLDSSFLLNTEDLNNKEKVLDLLKFIGYENPLACTLNKDEIRNR